MGKSILPQFITTILNPLWEHNNRRRNVDFFYGVQTNWEACEVLVRRLAQCLTALSFLLLGYAASAELLHLIGSKIPLPTIDRPLLLLATLIVAWILYAVLHTYTERIRARKQ